MAPSDVYCMASSVLFNWSPLLIRKEMGNATKGKKKIQPASKMPDILEDESLCFQRCWPLDNSVH